MSDMRRMMMMFTRPVDGGGGGGDEPTPELSYITDGLVFRLDGIEKGENEGTWTDLVGGIVFTNNNVINTDYGWSFNGSSSYFYSTSVLTGSSNHTVEVCFKPKDTNKRYCLFACNDRTQYNYLFLKDGNNITFLQYANTYTIALSANQKYSVSLNLDRGLLNGISISKNSNTDYWTTRAFYIGSRAGGDYFNGEIYAIRVYNRKLSQSEQLRNFSVDNKRFNLGL